MSYFYQFDQGYNSEEDSDYVPGNTSDESDSEYDSERTLTDTEVEEYDIEPIEEIEPEPEPDSNTTLPTRKSCRQTRQPDRYKP